MDKLTYYRYIIQKILTEYEALASQTPNPEGVDSILGFDEKRDQYSVSQSHEVQQVYTPGRGARPCAPTNVLHLLGNRYICGCKQVGIKTKKSEELQFMYGLKMKKYGLKKIGQRKVLQLTC
jgi:XisI protein